MARSLRKGCLIVLLILLLAAAGAWVYLRLGPFQTAGKISPEIARITGQPNAIMERLRYTNTSIGRIGQYRTELSDNETVYFDIDSNKNVVSYFRSGQHAKQVTISAEQAVTAARTFAKQYYPDATLLSQKPETAELVNSQEDHLYYDIGWTQIDTSSGARLPRSTNVQVNAQTGEVIGYQRVYVNDLPAIEVKLSKEKGIDAAVQQIQPYMDHPTAQEAELIVTRAPTDDPKGDFRVVWQVHIQGKMDENGETAGVFVLIDAATGDALQAIPVP